MEKTDTAGQTPEDLAARAGWYREVASPPELADCLVSLWETRIPEVLEPTRVRILPNACIDIVIYKSDPSWGDGAARLVAPPHRSYLVGSTLREFIVRSVGWRHVVGASIRPEGVQPLLGAPAAAIGEHVALLDEVIGRSAGEMEDRVLSASPEVAMTALGQVLLERRRSAPPPDALLSRAVTSVRRGHGRQRISSLAAALNLSPRTLERHFLTHVGMSPKLFSRLVRFDRAVRHLARRGETAWADFAVAHGYTDQAHFINEFREFAGISPADFEGESQ